ncbi:MAG: GNAT family N-acetyltransferase [Rhodocyclales bacterium]|nr:GNAT family N-acetyltransferase [Rhodocyclales bacterium]
MSGAEFSIPTAIESPRLVLRRVCANDWRELHEYYADAESTRYTVRAALDEEGSRRITDAMMQHWQRRGYGPYALVEKQGGAVLGVCGLWYPKEWPEPEIKWALCRRHWGRGYAAEAARAVQAMAAQHRPDLHLISLIHVDNLNSINLAQAVGATREKEIPFRDALYAVFRHPRAVA